MKLRNIAFVIATLGLAAAALAGEDVKTKIVIAVVDSDGDGEVRFDLNSDDLGFDLHDMQEGENRSIVDESGRTILITREADGFSFDVDGKTIKMPLFDGGHHGSVWIDGDDVGNIDVHVMRDAHFGTAGVMDGITIISGKPIDEATQQAIESLLESSGHGDGVRFIDSDRAHGGIHKIKVIKKKVEVTQ
jgi:hypothetical protein